MNDNEFIELNKIKEKIVGKCSICKGNGGYIIPTEGKEWATMIDCKCMKRFKKIKKYYLANIPRFYWGFTIKDIKDKTIKIKIKKYIKKIKYCINNNLHLILVGGIGSGKTLALSLVLKYLLKKTDYKCKYFTVNDLLNFKETDLATINEFDIIAIDDVGIEYHKVGSSYANDILNNILKQRMSKQKLVLLGTKYSSNKLKMLYSDDIIENIFNNCMTILMPDFSFNRIILKQKIKKLLE